LQNIAEIFARYGDDFLIQGLTSIIGQEGEQEAFFRILQDKVPNELPFLTTGVRDFAFTAIQRFVIPGSCPDIDTIKLNTFASLDLVSSPAAETAIVHFTYDNSYMTNQTLSAVYINQQNPPIVETVSICNTENNTVMAQALFPYSENEMNGLTILALTSAPGPFRDGEAVANATVFGPAFIIVN
jgi:hypothetical protein